MKNFKSLVLLVLLVLVSFSFVGCANRYSGTLPEARYVPIPEKEDAKVFTSIMFCISDEMYLSEHVAGAISWPAVIVKNDGQEINATAVCLGPIGSKKRVMANVIFPGYEEYQGAMVAVFSRGGTRICSPEGVYVSRKGKPWSKINTGDYSKDFLAVVDSSKPYCRVLDRDSKIFKKIVTIYKKFRVAEIDFATGYIVKNYGSSVGEDMLVEIGKRDSVVRNFYDIILSKTKLHLGPIITPQGLLIQLGISKVIDLPSIFDPRFDQLGYMERQATMEDAASIAIRAIALDRLRR